MHTYRGFLIHHDSKGHHAGVEDLPWAEPAPGEVLMRVAYSSVNYKDALAGTGKIPKTFPLVGGADAVGRIERSNDGRLRVGDEVVVTGYGMSFDHDGGYAEYLRVPASWPVSIPQGLDLRSAMILGTAGFTVALAIHRMQVNGQRPDMGSILVTGATGGVGSLAVELLAHLGYEVAAVSGKQELHDWLRTLGATRLLGRDELPGEQRPLEKAVWGGALDNVGGEMLAQITRTVRPAGNIASVGLAGGYRLETTVMPFILRGVSLLGINSVDVPRTLRQTLWDHLATDWRPPHLESIATGTIRLEDLPDAFERVLAGRTHGRLLVTLGAG